MGGSESCMTRPEQPEAVEQESAPRKAVQDDRRDERRYQAQTEEPRRDAVARPETEEAKSMTSSSKLVSPFKSYFSSAYPHSKQNGSLNYSQLTAKKSYPDGSTYEGQVNIDGVPHGTGRYERPNQNVYEGEFSLGKLHGWGVMTDSEGNRYTGTWANNMREGSGIELFADGSRFEGLFSKDKKSGHGRVCSSGVLYTVDRDVYEGQFANGMFHGFGTYKWKSKQVYVGNWADGKISGKGKLLYSNGDIFVGNFENGRRTGYGTLKTNNLKIEGNWLENQLLSKKSRALGDAEQSF